MSLANARRLIEYYYHNDYDVDLIYEILLDRGMEVEEAWVKEVYDELVKAHG